MKRAVMIFSHPNHELAILGTVQRFRPHMIFLTDGGGAERVGDSRHGLESIGALERACFLNHPEDDLYRALLERRTDFFRELALQVRSILDRLDFDAVYCDAIEFYNPLHDLALPLTRKALEPWPGLPVFEVPLIYQTADAAERYEIQRAPAALLPRGSWVNLDAAEWRVKVEAQRHSYGSLSSQLGGLISGSTYLRARRELFLAARADLPLPAAGQVLRYDRRGEELRRAAAVEQAISYSGHYVPMYRSLCAAPA
ncbi:MAG: hypothetical protein P4L83_04360 [Nevskia sp.]|nr:hypothetical protein [Nevskia sp.]